MANGKIKTHAKTNLKKSKSKGLISAIASFVIGCETPQIM
jgi:hypothetical protein